MPHRKALLFGACCIVSCAVSVASGLGWWSAGDHILGAIAIAAGLGPFLMWSTDKEPESKRSDNG